jgi:hypothetical protein
MARFFTDDSFKEMMERQREFKLREQREREEAWKASQAEYARRAKELAEARARTPKETVKPVVRSLDLDLSLAEMEPEEVNAWQDWDPFAEETGEETQTTGRGRKRSLGKGRKLKRRSSKTKKRVVKRRSSRRKN